MAPAGLMPERYGVYGYARNEAVAGARGLHLETLEREGVAVVSTSPSGRVPLPWLQDRAAVLRFPPGDLWRLLAEGAPRPYAASPGMDVATFLLAPRLSDRRAPPPPLRPAPSETELQFLEDVVALPLLSDATSVPTELRWALVPPHRAGAVGGGTGPGARARRGRHLARDVVRVGPSWPPALAFHQAVHRAIRAHDPDAAALVLRGFASRNGLRGRGAWTPSTSTVAAAAAASRGCATCCSTEVAGGSGAVLP